MAVRYAATRLPTAMTGPSMQATAVILAAGLGTRMKSTLPKTLHQIAGRPMLRHLLASCEAVFDRIVVVIGPEMEAVARAAAPHPCVVQHERLGTAMRRCRRPTAFGEGEVAVLYADNPLISPRRCGACCDRRRGGDAGLALLAMRPADPGRYGRVIARDGIVDADRRVGRRDRGRARRDAVQCRRVLRAGGRYGALAARRARRQRQGRILPDRRRRAGRADGQRVAAVEAPIEELRGINSRAELAEAEAVVQQPAARGGDGGGVTMTEPESVFLCADTVLGPDVTIGPNVVFGPGVRSRTGAEIRAFSHLEGCIVGPGCVIGPFARLRPGTVLGRDAHVGNFVELKAAMLGDGAKANHLTYLGDAAVGARHQYRRRHHHLQLRRLRQAPHRQSARGVFVGSDASLVAPVTVGDGAIRRRRQRHHRRRRRRMRWRSAAAGRSRSRAGAAAHSAPTTKAKGSQALMCGIVGVIGQRTAAPLLLDALRRLEYRGYDSAGIATLVNGHIERRRAEGKLGNLAAALDRTPLTGTTGIGHTRWATHGAPTESNAHPHGTARVSIVHNGIIENHAELRAELEAAGQEFSTETDTETVAQLVDLQSAARHGAGRGGRRGVRAGWKAPTRWR